MLIVRGTRAMPRFCLTTAALLLLAAPLSAAAVTEGMPLADALDELRREGLAIVYSTLVVRPEMRVLDEPRSSTPRDVLVEILSPHGLALRTAPQGQLVVVRAGQPQAPPADPPPAPAAMPMLLEEIVVTPSHFRLLREQIETRETLTRDQIESMPHLGGDAFWAVKRLPGTGGADVSARFNVRGGVDDELLVVLDGFELYEPFHLKDFMSVFSTVDAAAVGSIDLLTGGFPVEYGDRMSGVMEITSATPAADGSTSVSLGTINSYLVTSGTAAAGRSWLVASRGWYPDLLLGELEGIAGEIRTDYYDVFAKWNQPLGTRSNVSLALLAAYDDLAMEIEEPDELETVLAEYDSRHAWANVTTQWSRRVHSRTVAGAGHLTRERAVAKIEEEGELSVDDRRSFSFASFRQDWMIEVSERQIVKAGFDLRTQRASYDYVAASSFEEGIPRPGGDPGGRSFAVDLDPRGESGGAYVADRIRLGSSAIVEVGVRWDEQSGTDEHQISPRVQLRYDLGSRSVARLAWGRYFQSQRLNELQVEDGVSTFFPAQLAQHWLASIEHRFGSGVGVRVEAYHKAISRVRPRYENLFNPLELFPEAQSDRVLVAPAGASATGVEVIVRSDPARGPGWWGSYSWGRAVDEIADDAVPRSWDQRHAVSFGVDFALPRAWNVSLGGTWHTGWPTTALTARLTGDEEEPEIELVPGPRNRERLPEYFRLDLRASRTLPIRTGTLTFIAEILNVTNRKNVCCIDEVEAELGEGGVIEMEREERYWAPITPTLALRWRL